MGEIERRMLLIDDADAYVGKPLLELLECLTSRECIIFWAEKKTDKVWEIWIEDDNKEIDFLANCSTDGKLKWIDITLCE